MSEITPVVEKIRRYADRVILFGSCAEGLDTEDSDVDLFMLAGEKEEVEAELRKTKLTRKITPIILNALEFVELREKDNVLHD